MTPETLRHLPAADAATLPPLLQALWHDAHNDWAAAHALAQDVDTPDGARVHAFLHRREGDTFNANYWYRRAGQPPFTSPLEDEWTALAATLLATLLTAVPPKVASLHLMDNFVSPTNQTRRSGNNTLD